MMLPVYREPNVEIAFLYATISNKELEHIITHQYKQFPPRFFSKKYFCPMLNIEHAIRVASEKGNFPLNTTTTHVVRFLMRSHSIKKYLQGNGDISNPNSPIIVKTHELPQFNYQIVGFIECIETINLFDPTNQLVFYG